ncbi:hypothetical protein BDP27DRAFT_1342259 [Rhodocollybia butyracea]|uniref:Uncharacterized protein n=1 Tax=Rhodocollybia butyracea TaxID=206335 RepID=A0A9P5PBF3_9AGAR|nr:hypothetical protein BDP27DRAFT_1342259 [Rhodocollybia butyracea]
MNETNDFPPLIGDGKGCYRIRMLGNSAAQLASILNLPLLSLDKVLFRPGWKEVADEDFRERIQDFVEENMESGWVVDGDYERRGGSVLQELATDVIWLDPPFLLYFPRIILRTFLRILGLAPPCSPGCRETPRNVFFSKESIIWYCITQHRPKRQKNVVRMELWGLGVGSQGQKMRRLEGWGAELREWMDSIRAMKRSK